MGKVEELFEINPVKVVERVPYGQMGLHGVPKIGIGSDYEGKVRSTFPQLTLKIWQLKGC